jgi:flagellar biosynthesis protein FlhF
MTEAMRQVREALGEEAIIVATHRSRRGRGVQLTAAVEEAPERAPAPARPSPRGEEHQAVRQALSYHGVPARLLDRLARSAAAGAAAGAADDAAALAAALDSYLGFAADPLPPPRGALMLVGPAGAGKTTTPAKLAARAALAGTEIAACSIDTTRAGAVAQLQAYAEVLNQPLLTAETPRHLGVIVGKFGEAGRPLLIDAPGVNPHDPEALHDLRQFLKTGPIEPLLVLAAGGDAEEMADTALAFARLGCRRMIVTRIDAVRRYGGVLAAAEAAKMDIAAAGVSSSIPHGLTHLPPGGLARLLLRDPTRPALCPEPGADPHEP